MSRQLVKIPPLLNVFVMVIIAAGFLLFAIAVESGLGYDIPDLAWGLVGVTVGKLLDMAAAVVQMYSSQVQALADAQLPPPAGPEPAPERPQD